MAAKDRAQKIPEPQQDRSRRTHDAILKATEQLMAARPFDQIAVAEIAKAAGISVGNFYNRFPDKTALLLSMFDDYERERAEYLIDAFAPDHWQGQSLQVRAQKLAALLVDFFWTRRALVRSFIMYYRADLGALAQPARGRLETISQTGANVLADAMSGRDRAARAELGMQTLVALCREFILFGDDPSKKRLKLSRKALTHHLTRVLLGCVT